MPAPNRDMLRRQPPNRMPARNPDGTPRRNPSGVPRRYAAQSRAKVPAAPKESLFQRLKKNWFRPDLLFFSAVLVYFELVFKLSTMRSDFGTNLFLILLFSMSVAGILSLVSTIFSKKVNRVIKTVLLFLLMIPYGLEYFIFREYNIFYDVNTIVNGAGGAATDFKDEIIRLVFSFNGLFHIFLLAIPAILYLIFAKRFGRLEKMQWKQRTVTAVAAVCCFLLGVGLTHANSRYSSFYDKEYSFPKAVSNFGLLTGFRLDITRGSGDGIPEFELEVAQTTTTGTQTTPLNSITSGTGTETSTTTTTTVTYGQNVLDIDFAEKATKDKGTFANLDKYVASQQPSSKNAYTGMFKGKNLILITAEAFTKEVIREDLTPTLYRLTTKGIQFKDFYQPASAGTTGGEFQNIFGLMPMKGGSSFPSFTKGGNSALTMAYQLNKEGYWGKAYHNNTHTFYSRNQTHNKLGYSEGFMGYGNGMEKYVKKQWPQSDLEMFRGTIQEYIDQPHFNVYYMTVSGHNGYDQNNAMSKKNWDRVQGLNYSDTVKAYIACNLELEDALTELIRTLEDKGIADDTVICMTADHFPYGLDASASYGQMQYLSELYGYNVTNAIQRDHNTAILWCGSLEKSEPIVVNAPASSLDLLPTLSNLFGVEFDSRLMPGRDVFSDAEAIYFDREYNWKTELGYYLAGQQKFYPNQGVEIPENYVDRIKTIVRNKLSFCQGTLNSNYYAHLFPQK